MANADRLPYLDCLRVFSLVCIVAIHATDPLFAYFPKESGVGMYAVAVGSLVRVGVPLFFMISGALMLRSPPSSVWNFFATRLTRILVPLAVYSALYVAFQSPQALSTWSGWRNFLAALLAGPVFFHLWFVYSLVGVYFVVPLLSMAISKAPRATVAYSVGAMATCYSLWLILPLFGLKFGFDVSLVNIILLYFLFGYVVSLFPGPKNVGWLWVAALLGYAGNVAIRLCSDELGKWEHGPSMQLLAVAIFALAMRYASDLKPAGLGYRITMALSAGSYGVYLIHILFMKLILADRYLIAANYGTPYLSLPVVIVLTIAASFVAAWIIDKLIADPLSRMVAWSMRRGTLIALAAWHAVIGVKG